MVTIFINRNGQTEQVKSIDRVWLNPASNTFVWVDLGAPSIPELLLLSDTFAFHPLSVEDARAELHYPKIEAYDGYLYAILHGIAFSTEESEFATHDIDFFIGPNYLVTVHNGHSRSIAELHENGVRNPKIMGEGPVALFHRIVDMMVDHYGPEVQKLEDRLDELEASVFDNPTPDVIRAILNEKRRVGGLRRIIVPQRDVISRLARRDFVDISTDMSFRFRDVNDHLQRLADDATTFQDRITGILDAYLTNVSNRLNEVMKVLTIVSTIFMPLTLVAGVWGMNVHLPQFPGSDVAQFWWVLLLCIAIIVSMLTYFRVRRWI
ncbi:MAG TPA: magnesium/cobalt transporter CorA [Vicinamibacterales bacterium]|nr:magnesium/cobalt transporter CorA [Vicinamibacterales bacterium]